MHYYKRNLGDYAKKAGRLTIIQHGVYNLLLDACYDRETFPTRDEAIDWVWASTAEEIEAVDFVLSKFFTPDGAGKYVQKRVQEEVAEYQKFKELQSEKGKKGGRPKKPPVKEKNPAGLKENPTESRGKPEQSRKKPKPLTTNQEPLTSSKNTLSGEPDFVVVADRVIEELNRQAGKHFRLTKNNRGAVIARLRDGFTEQDCLAVISNRCMRWLGTERAQYLRPDTLFRPKNFESYLNDNGETDAAHRPGGNPATAGRKQTPAERTRAARAAAPGGQPASEPPPVDALGAHGGNVRPHLGLAAGGRTE